MSTFKLKSNGAINPNTIQGLLTDWGRSQQQAPAQNETLKTSIMQALQTNTDRNHLKDKINFSWLPLVLAGCAVLAFFIVPTLKINSINTPTATKTVYQNTDPFAGLSSPAPLAAKIQNTNDQSRAEKKFAPQSRFEAPVQLGGADTPASDAREFLKTNYSANLQTRDVEKLSTDVQSVIRGFNGRIDSSGYSQDTGYVEFVVPAGQFELFKLQIKNLVNYRFYSEQQNTQNLLPQKQIIEDQQKQANKSLGQLNSDKEQLIQTHNSTIASLNSKINSINAQLAILQNETTNDASKAWQIANQIQDSQAQKQKLQAQINQENNNYSSQLNSYNIQIQDEQNNLDSLKNQTNNLLGDVATINGSISIAKINLWNVFNAYCPPGYWVTGLLILASLIAYIADRHRAKFIIP